MKKTKEVILETALRLFNLQGLPKVTLRSIAQDMGISQGNLNYHYKKREDIIESLYFQLVMNIDENLKRVNNMRLPADKLVHSFLMVIDKMMLNFYEYRFIMVDFVQIVREHETICTHFRELTDLREQQFFDFLSAMTKQGLLSPPLLDSEYKNLYKRMQIMANFWISHSIILSDSNCVKADLFDYSQILSQSIYPYLTDKGRAEYHSYVSNL